MAIAHIGANSYYMRNIPLFEVYVSRNVSIFFRRYSWLFSVGLCLAAFVFVFYVSIGRQEDLSTLHEEDVKALSLSDTQTIAHPDEYRTIALSYRIPTDKVLALYRSVQAAQAVKDFYSAIVGSPEIALKILEESEKQNVSPSLAIALAWEESHFRRTAINRNKNSVDRGIFQLNNRSFPKLSESDFFTIDTNVEHGVAHLKLCLDLAGNEVAGLAMYNAGTNRVRKNTTPASTLNYVHRILSFKTGIEKLFEEQVARMWFVMEDGSVRSIAPIPVQAVASGAPTKKGFLKARFGN